MNGEDKDLHKKVERKQALKKLNLPEGSFCLGYLGTVWNCYDLNGMLQAMEVCRKTIKNLYLIMIGDGPDLAYLKDKARKMNMDSHIIFLGYVQPDLLFEVLGAVDIGLMNMTYKGLEFGGPVTSRFATYANFNMPVISNDLYMDSYPEELCKGLSLVPPEDSKALADMIMRLYNHPDERKEKAKILYEFVQKYLTWNVVSRNILDIMMNDRIAAAESYVHSGNSEKDGDHIKKTDIQA